MWIFIPYMLNFIVYWYVGKYCQHLGEMSQYMTGQERLLFTVIRWSDSMANVKINLSIFILLIIVYMYTFFASIFYQSLSMTPEECKLVLCVRILCTTLHLKVSVLCETYMKLTTSRYDKHFSQWQIVQYPSSQGYYNSICCETLSFVSSLGQEVLDFILGLASLARSRVPLTVLVMV
jgi:hypothetical protein